MMNFRLVAADSLDSVGQAMLEAASANTPDIPSTEMLVALQGLAMKARNRRYLKSFVRR